MFTKGTRKISQKVGEEAVETIIGAMANDDENFIYEAGDLLYHLIVLLTHKGYRIEDIVRELQKRHSWNYSVLKKKYIPIDYATYWITVNFNVGNH